MQGRQNSSLAHVWSQQTMANCVKSLGELVLNVSEVWKTPSYKVFPWSHQSTKKWCDAVMIAPDRLTNLRSFNEFLASIILERKNSESCQESIEAVCRPLNLSQYYHCITSLHCVLMGSWKNLITRYICSLDFWNFQDMLT